MDVRSDPVTLLAFRPAEARRVALLVEESAGLARLQEPVSVGVPLPRGAVRDAEQVALLDPTGAPCPLQAQVLARWPDGSVQWLLADFQADVAPYATAAYELAWGPGAARRPAGPALGVTATRDAVIVDTGPATFLLDRHRFGPFAAVRVDDREILDAAASGVVLTDERGDACRPVVEDFRVEVRGPLRATIRVDGTFRTGAGAPHAAFIARVTLHAGRRLAQVTLTVRNPRAARHPGGLWDLGDPGSIHLVGLSLAVRLRCTGSPAVGWTLDLAHPPAPGPVQRLEIYQDSSGGDNWCSSNHLDRFGQVPLRFAGYRVVTERGALPVAGGRRATPVVTLADPAAAVAAAIPRFWQNFPKALEVRDGTLFAHLFPPQAGAPVELQGGEQKTPTVWLDFAPGHADLRWACEPLRPRLAPDWWAETQAIPYLTPMAKDPSTELVELANVAVAGPQSFVDRREIIDEYGWRNFGDLYADHEAVGHYGDEPLVAHYNNQYDGIQAFLLWYARSGDPRWWELAEDLARHVVDIDLYHTTADRPAFNGGFFWHTDHYTSAATATHRAFSRRAGGGRHGWQRGGGPSNEHNYTTGLLLYHLCTGDPAAREAVLQLADWVLAMDDGQRTAWRFLDPRDTGLASATVERSYHGPGRGAGNSINACLDAYALSQEPRYLEKAEALVRRCIHPRDDIAARNLSDVESRWSYTVFLQVLGKYLDFKAEYLTPATGTPHPGPLPLRGRGGDSGGGRVSVRPSRSASGNRSDAPSPRDGGRGEGEGQRSEPDDMYAYAQASLLHYAAWMLEHEVPYTTVLDRVKIPTETWAAQDIRKANVFHFAAKHAPPPLREAFRARADFFFQACLRDLRSFPTRTLTRPLVLLLANGPMHAYCLAHPEEVAPRAAPRGFGEPAVFVPQLWGLYRARARLRAALDVPRALLRRVRPGRRA